VFAQPGPRASVSVVDVTVVGGGIIGLATALALLKHPARPRVALIEAEASTSGGDAPFTPSLLPYGGRATGAGQGYLWLAHRDPASPLWGAAVASKALWAEWVGEEEGGAWMAGAEHRATGSLLLAPSTGGAGACAARAARLAAVGVACTPLSSAELAALEPALAGFPPGGGALLTHGDAQIDGRGAARALLDACRRVGRDGGRWVERVGAPVTGIKAGSASTSTSVTLADGSCLVAERGVVIAAGAWSGRLVAAALARTDPAAAAAWAAALAPRRGHLLVLRPPPAMPALRHGMMEAGYTRHYSGGGGGEEPAEGAVSLAGLDLAAADEEWGVVFTAAPDASGTSLLIGSSREDADEFTGSAPCPAAVRAVLVRAAAFLPGLREGGWLEAAVAATSTPGGDALRVGLRPAMVGVRPHAPPPPPAIGCVAPGLFIAAGHEGSGLTLAPATGRLVAGLVMEGEGGGVDAGWAREVDPRRVGGEARFK